MGLSCVPSWASPIVSRETLDMLDCFLSRIREWSKKINLVSKGDLNHLEDRHIWDSVQLGKYFATPRTWTDIGSGGGFPGIILAIFAKSNNIDARGQLIESDKRKCAFLIDISKQLSLNVAIHADRIETTNAQPADLITARALAPLTRLLEHSSQNLVAGGRMLFPKGENWRQEIDVAKRDWVFDVEAHQSMTNEKAVVLEICNLERAVRA